MEVVLTGTQALEFALEIQSCYFPNKVVAGAVEPQDVQLQLLEHRFTKGKSMIFVCQDETCQLPVDSVASALALMHALHSPQ